MELPPQEDSRGELGKYFSSFSSSLRSEPCMSPRVEAQFKGKKDLKWARRQLHRGEDGKSPKKNRKTKLISIPLLVYPYKYTYKLPLLRSLRALPVAAVLRYPKLGQAPSKVQSTELPTASCSRNYSRFQVSFYFYHQPPKIPKISSFLFIYQITRTKLNLDLLIPPSLLPSWA